MENVCKSYYIGDLETEVLKGANLVIQNGEFGVVFGVSGCGKTTLLNLLGALDRPDSGRIIVDGDELTRMRARELTAYRRRKVGFVFQFFNLLPTLTALENIEFGLEVTGVPLKEARERARNYLYKVDLGEKENKFPHQLSGGEQQRVAIARALAREPRIILADEPTGNLDQRNAEMIIDLMARLHKEFKRTLLVVTHNRKIAEVAERVSYISNGEIIAG
jgi:putative ABC transport system ATP-binding protein